MQWQCQTIDLREAGKGQAMGLSSNGTVAVLAGKDKFEVIGLTVDGDGGSSERGEKPSVTRSTHDHRVTEVAEMQFNLEDETLCAVAQKSDVEFIRFSPDGGMTTERASRQEAHERDLTDLSWHDHDKNVIASCGGDDRIRIWDWRDTARPQLTLESVNGARQVCWERTHGNLLATSHFDSVKLWDRRNADRPVQYIHAHPGQPIHALDFSTNRQCRFVSSGADKSVKFWDVKDVTKCKKEQEIRSPVEIWKIRENAQYETVQDFRYLFYTFKTYDIISKSAELLQRILLREMEMHSH